MLKSIALSAKPRATDVNSLPPRIRFSPNRLSKIFLTAGTNDEPSVRKTISTSCAKFMTSRCLRSLAGFGARPRPKLGGDAAPHNSGDRHPLYEDEILDPLLSCCVAVIMIIKPTEIAPWG